MLTTQLKLINSFDEKSNLCAILISHRRIIYIGSGKIIVGILKMHTSNLEGKKWVFGGGY
jgi:hypothetical protein